MLQSVEILFEHEHEDEHLVAAPPRCPLGLILQQSIRDSRCNSVPIPCTLDPLGFRPIGHETAFDQDCRQAIGAQHPVAAMPDTPVYAVRGLDNPGMNKNSQSIRTPVIVIGFDSVSSFAETGIVVN